MSEQCNWRTAEGIGWIVCQKERGHQDGEHVAAGRYSNPAIQRVWEEGPRIFAEPEDSRELFEVEFRNKSLTDTTLKE